jgi:hypothetical protein
MNKIRDTELCYMNGDRMLEGDMVELEYMRMGGGVVPDKTKGVITYKNASFYIVGDACDITIASVLENNAQVPHKYPMSINKIK